MRLFRCLLVTGTAALAAGSLAFTAGSTVAGTAAAGKVHVAASAPSAKFLANARVALTHYLSHTRPGVMLVHPGAVRPGATRTGVASATASDSYNWSGYANSSTTAQAFSKVAGSWVTPKLATCSKEDELTSEWVGIDGYGSGTVEQDGSLDWCFKGKATYFTWYEMYPAGTIEVGRTLKPGDHITATVSRSGTKYTLTVKDKEHSKSSFTKTATCAATTCLDESAEWIAERPEFSIGIAPLADYHSWKVTGAEVTKGGKSGKINSFDSYKIGMIDATDSYLLSTTSTLSGGNSFTTSWKNSY